MDYLATRSVPLVLYQKLWFCTISEKFVILLNSIKDGIFSQLTCYDLVKFIDQIEHQI
jgi:hypothetical protein